MIMTEIRSDIEGIVKSTGTGREAVIPILQAIQRKYNYLPEEALREVCARTDIIPSQIIGVASFYSQFRLQPVGKHIIKLCVGTACHVKGSNLVLDALQRELGLDAHHDTDATGTYTVEKVSCLGCCTLAPVVQIDRITYGHVAPDQISHLLEDFQKHKDRKPGKQFRTGDGKEIQGEIRIGLGSCCVASGSEAIREAVVDVLETNGLNVNLKHVGCVGMCHQVPLVEIVPAGKEPVLYTQVDPRDVKQIIENHFNPPSLFKKLSVKALRWVADFQDDGRSESIERYTSEVREKHISTFLGRQVSLATENRGVINPLDLFEYERMQGFIAFRRCLSGLQPSQVISKIVESGIRGRGGAGFLSGKKWEMVADQDAPEKYVICNGDEGDPGAFMDRMLLESYPYRVIEGMLIAGYATGATKGYFYIRAEYPLAVSRVRQALENCKAAGLTGSHVLGSNFSFDITLYEGAGAFVCGEETALIASIEGDRGFPRMRPPYPAVSGLWKAPTLVNNTETLALISWILRNGSARFKSLGTDTSSGTKVFALAGKVVRGGLIEVPMGITIREIVEEIGGGIANGHTFKAIQIGGPSGGCIPASLADTPIDYESLTKLGAMMGSGGLVVLDDTDCMVDIARYFLSFTQKESCGKCTFCRIGTRRMLDILDRLCTGQGKSDDLAELERLAIWTQKGSLCGLGRSAPNPVLTTLKYFREEYEAHLEGRCPTARCMDLIHYSINDQCIGCTLCAQKCPTQAIEFRPHEQHEIDMEKCVKCDTCRIICPVQAVIKS
jgi:NADH:ubiquinone oxidoreductase subunit F (NADH-binding)/NADH:ubiquinone oxidoreductase subunit E/NAD-dependent dihydropyrimidine dehydrogenase PreA subunit